MVQVIFPSHPELGRNSALASLCISSYVLLHSTKWGSLPKPWGLSLMEAVRCSLTFPPLFHFNLFPVGVFSVLLFSQTYLGMFHAFPFHPLKYLSLNPLFSPCIFIALIVKWMSDLSLLLSCVGLAEGRGEDKPLNGYSIGIGRENIRGFYPVWQLTFSPSLKWMPLYQRIVFFFHTE